MHTPREAPIPTFLSFFIFLGSFTPSLGCDVITQSTSVISTPSNYLTSISLYFSFPSLPPLFIPLRCAHIPPDFDPRLVVFGRSCNRANKSGHQNHLLSFQLFTPFGKVTKHFLGSSYNFFLFSFLSSPKESLPIVQSICDVVAHLSHACDSSRPCRHIRRDFVFTVTITHYNLSKLVAFLLNSPRWGAKNHPSS